MDLVAASLLAVWLTIVAGAVVYLAWRQIQVEKQDLVDLIQAWTTKPNETTPSQAEMFGRAIAHLVADEVKASISGALMGHASALSKQVDQAGADLAESQMAGVNPLMAMLLQFSPGLRKRVTKNPYAAMALSALPLDKIVGSLAGHRGNGAKAPAPASSFELGK